MQRERRPAAMLDVVRADTRRYLLLVIWLMIAALPVVYVASKAFAASRNIVFWDEFDTALALILRIDAGAGWREILERLFALNNEHRTMTSRALFAASYWLTGTVNFHVIGVIGNLFQVGTCAALIASVTGWERRVRLTVLLAFLMFQLEHFESFIWSGASIDHFQVVMLAVLAIAFLARGRPADFYFAAIFGFLATFTLAQGNVVWPVGGLLLAHARRWKEFAGWCVIGAIAVAGFLHGFEFNPDHKIVDPSFQHMGHVALYWLSLVGAPLTFGEAAYAPIASVALLVTLGVLFWRGMATRQPVAFFSALFAIGALALVALGRAELAGTAVNSRYMVLGALALALVIFMVLELAVERDPSHPFRLLAWLTPALAVFALTANLKFAPMIESFVEVRDRAATSFEQFGVDGKGITRIHPRDRHADIILKMAEDAGVYRLPQFSSRVNLPEAKSSARIISHFDELLANERAVTAGGWAMIKGRTSQRNEIYLVLRSEQSTLFFSTITLQRPDVAKAYNEPGWRLAGFRAVIRRNQLPAENFAVGVLISDGATGEFMMSGHRLDLTSAAGKALRADSTP